MEIKRIGITLNLLFMLAGLLPAQTTGTIDSAYSAQSARIIHIVASRIYLDRGELAGLDQLWQVRWPVTESDSIDLPLSWIGRDISCFIKPDSGFHNYQVADSIRLFRIPLASPHGSKIVLAWPHLPALPHQDRKDLWDREFFNLLCTPLHETRAAYKSMDDSRSDMGLGISLFSDLHIASGKDVYYTLRFCLDRLNLYNYLQKYLAEAVEKHFRRTMTWGDSLIGKYNLLIDETTIPLLKTSSLAEDTLSLMRKSGAPVADRIVDTSYTITSGRYYITQKNEKEIVLARSILSPHSAGCPDTIIIKIEPDYLKRKLMFQLGEVDFLDLNFSDVDQFKADYIVREAPLAEAAWLTVNNLKTSLSDGTLAAALSHLINKESLCRVALGNSARPLELIIPGWSDNIEPLYSYDRGKGQSLLKSMGKTPRYLSLYICPDDFWNRRTAEYIKGILERENIYVTIYSEMLSGEGRPYDLFQQFDMMLGRIDVLRTGPLYILNQLTFHYDLAQVTSNRSLYYSPEYDSLVSTNILSPSGDLEKIRDYYRGLTEIPAGICLFKPIRQIAASRRIANFSLAENGMLILGSIEFADEAQR